jgi:hypothetical protein
MIGHGLLTFQIIDKKNMCIQIQQIPRIKTEKYLLYIYLRLICEFPRAEDLSEKTIDFIRLFPWTHVDYFWYQLKSRTLNVFNIFNHIHNLFCHF